MAFRFDRNQYQKLLGYLQSSGHRFETSHTSLKDPLVKSYLLRHDIDFDLEAAKVMATIESEMEVKAIYLVQVGCEFYNLKDSNSQEIVQDILKMGHAVGLHYDPNFESAMPAQMQKEILERIIKMNVLYVSNHNPGLQFKKVPLELGLEDLYSQEYFHYRKYWSDSTMLPRENVFELAKCYDRVQLLIHPEFWIWETQNVREFHEKLLQVKANQNSERVASITRLMEFSLLNRETLDYKLSSNLA